jgi:hypothetical protein
MLRGRWAIGCLMMMAFAPVGCGKKTPSETIVQGQILYRGAPLTGGLVVFAPNPDRGSDGPILTALIQPDGSYQLQATEEQPVRAGWYRIAVAPPAGAVQVPTAAYPYPGMSAKYRNPARSGLERQIKEGVTTTFSADFGDD